MGRRKKIVIIIGIVVFFLIIGYFSFPITPWSALKMTDIEVILVFDAPPEHMEILNQDEIEKAVELLQDIKVYRRGYVSNSTTGQVVKFIIIKVDGTETEILIAGNKTISINGVSYRTEYASTEALTSFAKDILSSTTEEIGTDTDVPSLLDGVTMEVTEYSDTSVTVRITNDTDMDIMCGEDFCLKILDEETGEWRDQDTVIDGYGFFDEAYMIQKDSPYEMVIDFEWLYGKLVPGRYQIVKTVMDFRGTGDYTKYVFAAEFDISMEEAEYSDAGVSMTSQIDISVSSFWNREGDVLLSAEDAAVVSNLVEGAHWLEGTGDCLDDCIIFMGGEEIQYHSDCGTFNDTVNEKSLHLTKEQQAAVNAILEKHIALGVGDALVTEEKPTQSVESSGTPQDGTIQDGKIYFEGFGWVDYEGGGTEGIYGEAIYENGNTIGIMD